MSASQPIAVAFVHARDHALSMLDLLPFEMWLAVQGRPLDVVVRGRQSRAFDWPVLRAQMKIRAARWRWEFDTPMDDCRVGFDFLTSRGVPPELLWGAVGPTRVMRLIATLDFALPADVACTETDLPAVLAGLGRPAPVEFPPARFKYVWRGGGRHDLIEWMKTRGSPGVRLLSLRTIGANADFDPDPAVLSALDLKVRRLVRLGPMDEGPAPSLARRAAWADLIREGRMLAHFSSWLNDAERRADSGRVIDFALPRVLGLSETAQMRIIP